VLSIARLLIVLVVLGALASCAPTAPEDQVEEARAQTTVELLSFAVREQPLIAPVEDAADAADAAATESETATEEEGESAEEETAAVEPIEVPVRTDVLLDLLVASQADAPLDGITVELEQVDSNQAVKDTRMLWVETPNLARGVGAQVTVTVEDVDYTEGDGFRVDVESPVPANERSQYREFQGLGES